MLVTATPRGRTIGQVLQQFWKRAGANMEIEQVDQATIPPRAFMRQFQLTPWRIVDLADPDIQMYANFQHRQPGRARQLLQSGTRQAARACAGHGRPGQAHRGLLRDQPADQQGGDLVLDLPEHLLRDLEREGERPAQDVQRGDRRIARLEGIAAHGVLRRAPAPVSGAGADCGFAADVLDRVAAAGRSRLRHPRRPGDAGERRGVAPRHGVGPADLVALSQLARQCPAGRFRPLVPHRPDRAAGGRPSGCRYRSS